MRANEKDLSRQLPLRRGPLRMRARSGRGHKQVQLLEICTKTRFWKALVKADGFRLLQGVDALSDYRFGGGTIHHLFCSRCGVTLTTRPMRSSPKCPSLTKTVGKEGRNDRWTRHPPKRATAEAPAGAVVATVRLDANATYDNGISL